MADSPLQSFGPFSGMQDQAAVNSAIRALSEINTTLRSLVSLSGNATINDLTLTGSVIGSVQDLNGAGAVNLTTLITKWGTTGSNAGTLADGSQGQIKIIFMDADGGDGTLTPTNFGNGTTITFNDVGDCVGLVFLGTDWWLLWNTGCTVA